MSKDSKDAQVVLRIPKQLRERIEAISAHLEAENPGVGFSLSSTTRLLIYRGLETFKEPKIGSSSSGSSS